MLYPFVILGMRYNVFNEDSLGYKISKKHHSEIISAYVNHPPFRPVFHSVKTWKKGSERIWIGKIVAI